MVMVPSATMSTRRGSGLVSGVASGVAADASDVAGTSDVVAEPVGLASPEVPASAAIGVGAVVDATGAPASGEVAVGPAPVHPAVVRVIIRASNRGSSRAGIRRMMGCMVPPGRCFIHDC